MPAFVLGTGLAATLMRHTRSAMLGVLKSDYVRTARAKGLSERTVLVKHALRNALVPIVTVTTLLFGELLGGAVLTEQIFTIPGFGKLVVDAVFNRDYAVVQGIVLCTAVGFIAMNILADAAYRLLNPRMRDAMSAVETSRLPAADPVAARSRSRLRGKLMANPAALLGAALVAFFIAVAALAPVLPIPDPIATDWLAVRKAPSAAHWLGTDEIGRDLLSRMIWGAQASLLAGVVSVAIAVLLGVPLGVASGYLRGWTDAVISRITEALLAAPFLILAIALAAFLGPSLTNAMIAIGLSAMPVFIRLARAQTMAVMTEDYVESARAIGLGPWRAGRALHPAQHLRRRSWCRRR